jgi:hypothetical protein
MKTYGVAYRTVQALVHGRVWDVNVSWGVFAARFYDVAGEHLLRFRRSWLPGLLLVTFNMFLVFSLETIIRVKELSVFNIYMYNFEVNRPRFHSFLAPSYNLLFSMRLNRTSLSG